MQIQSEREVMRMGGLERLSSANSLEFKQLVTSNLTPAHRVIELDFSEVNFVDSEGLGALIAIRRATTCNDVRIRILNPRANVLQLLDLVQFRRIFEVVT